MSRIISGPATAADQPANETEISLDLKAFRSIAERLADERQRSIALARECCSLHQRLWRAILVDWDREIEQDYRAHGKPVPPEQFRQLDQFAALSKMALSHLPYVPVATVEESAKRNDYFEHTSRRWKYAGLLREFGVVRTLNAMKRDNEQLLNRMAKELEHVQPIGALVDCGPK